MLQYTIIFRGKGATPTNDFWHQKTRVHGLSYGENKNSSGDEIANVNFFYDDIAQVLQNTEKRTYFV